jgi:large subunit ribosomal protein L24
MKIHKDDTVIVTTGKDKGKKGKVLKAYPSENKVVVEKVNIITKHMKRRGETAGQILKYEAPIDASNVMVLCPDTGKPSRIGYRIENGKKVRIVKKSGVVLSPKSSS